MEKFFPAFTVIFVLGLGLFIWYSLSRSSTSRKKASPTFDPRSLNAIPDFYTIENIEKSRSYEIWEPEKGRQTFVVRKTCCSYFYILAYRPTLPGNKPATSCQGWTNRLASNRFIEPKELLTDLPLEIRKTDAYS